MFNEHSPEQASPRAFAPAKINLFLHVGPVRPDGFHPISSLMVFADVGDTLQLQPSAQLELTVDGPFSARAGPEADNLVLRAAQAMPGAGDRWGFRLTKEVPVGAGLGGGSADAAAAIRLLAPHLPVGEAARFDPAALAAGLGSDVPACLWSEPLLAEGRGERLAPGPQIPSTPAVLIYPDAPVSTAAVYRAFDAQPHGQSADRPDPMEDCAGPEDVAALMAATRNDLEPVALALQPAVGEALAALRSGPEALAVRMSGSGSACFAVCASDADAAALAGRIAQRHSSWWVRACHIGGRPLQ